MPLHSRVAFTAFPSFHEAPDGHALPGTFFQGDRP
jgi:hypothetical protein